MTWWSRVVRRDRVEAQLDAELRDHLERQVADYIAQGMSEADARRRARLEFGGLDQIKELCRDARGTRLVEEVWQDVGYAARLFRKNPGFTAVAVLTLALGIGANMSVFSLIDALLLRPLPVRTPHTLVALWQVPHAEHFSYPQVQHFAEQPDLFSALCAFGTDVLSVGEPEAIEPTSAAWVTGNFYEVLGVRPALGRVLNPQDDAPGAAPVAVLTDAYWTRKFNRDPRIVGRTITIAGVPVVVIGITRPKFFGAVIGEAVDVTLPVNMRAQLQPDSGFLDDGARWLRVLARPQQGLTRDELTARLGVIWTRRMQATVPPTLAADVRNRMLSSTLTVVSGATGASSLRRTFRLPLVVAMALVLLVLLIACVNVANLLLARGATREREMALRLAVGAGRARLARQMLTESALLAIAGATLGLLFGSVGSTALINLITTVPSGPDSLGTLVLDLSFDWRMFAFTAGVVVLTTLLFGAAPAIRSAHSQPLAAINSGGNRITDSRRRAASLLITAQVALSVLVLVCAGLFARTLHNLRNVDRGFSHDGIVVADVDARRAGFKGEELAAFNRELLEYAERLPGVGIASVASITPLRGGGMSNAISINGQLPTDDEVYFNNVGPRYFAALQTPVVAGREFISQDNAAAAQVAIVNEAFARTFMRGDPIGQFVTPAGSDVQRQIVGVVRDAVYETLRVAPPPTVYIPFFQTGGRSGGDIGAALVIYAPQSIDEAAAAIRRFVIAKLSGNPPRIRTMTAQLERSVARERLIATLAATFGLLALSLAAIGLYGVLAYWVVRRTQEIGVRLALGAPRSTVLGMVVQDALRMIALGVIIGVPAAWALGRLIRSLLFGLTPSDTLTFVGAVSVLVITSLVAAWVPARRAMRVNPVVALRYE
jgi:predicted permease